MLPGSNRCELRLLLPDSMIGKEGFHDVVVENLTASSTWRSRQFQVMKERGTEMERLRRQAYQRPEWEYRHVCKTTTESSLDPGRGALNRPTLVSRSFPP